VKPANLLLDVTGTGRPHLRLSDFGVAGLLHEPRMTRQSTILGTPGYLAPEQLAGADPDPRQDLYAVGAVAVELLTGERPGADGKLPMVDGPLGEFIRRCSATDPADRPESANDVGRLLAASGVLPPAGTAPWAEDPDSPEVFDQLPPLPDSWSPAGPALRTQQPGPDTQHAGPRSQQADPGTQQVGASAQQVRPGSQQVGAGTAPEASSRSTLIAYPSGGGLTTSAEAAGRQNPPGYGEHAWLATRSKRVLRWIAFTSFAGAAGLLGAAVWLLLR
jgi:serine/threonine protein kinase